MSAAQPWADKNYSSKTTKTTKTTSNNVAATPWSSSSYSTTASGGGTNTVATPWSSQSYNPTSTGGGSGSNYKGSSASSGGSSSSNIASASRGYSGNYTNTSNYLASQIAQQAISAENARIAEAAAKARAQAEASAKARALEEASIAAAKSNAAKAAEAKQNAAKAKVTQYQTDKANLAKAYTVRDRVSSVDRQNTGTDDTPSALDSLKNSLTNFFNPSAQAAASAPLTNIEQQNLNRNYGVKERAAYNDTMATPGYTSAQDFWDKNKYGMAVATGVPAAIALGGIGVPAAANAAVNGVTAAAPVVTGAIATGANNAANLAKQGIASADLALNGSQVSGNPGLINRATTGVSNLANNVGTGVANVANNIGSGVSNAAGNVANNVSNIARQVYGNANIALTGSQVSGTPGILNQASDAINHAGYYIQSPEVYVPAAVTAGVGAGAVGAGLYANSQQPQPSANAYSQDAYARRVSNQNQVANPYTYTESTPVVNTGYQSPTLANPSQIDTSNGSNLWDAILAYMSGPEAIKNYKESTSSDTYGYPGLSTSGTATNSTKINPAGYNSLPWAQAGNSTPGGTYTVPTNATPSNSNKTDTSGKYDIKATGIVKDPNTGKDLPYIYTGAGAGTNNEFVNSKTATKITTGYKGGNDGTGGSVGPTDQNSGTQDDYNYTDDNPYHYIKELMPGTSDDYYANAKSDAEAYLNRALATLSDQGTLYANKLNDAFANSILNQQISNMKNNMSGFTSGEGIGSILASNILGNQSALGTMSDTAKEYFTQLKSDINSLAQKQADIPTNSLSALNNYYTALSTALGDYLQGYYYGDIASKVNKAASANSDATSERIARMQLSSKT